MSLIPEELLLARIAAEKKAREAAIAELRSLLDGATGTFAKQIEGVAAKLSAVDSKTSFDASAISGVIRIAQVAPGFAMAEELDLVEAELKSDVHDIKAQIVSDRLTQVNERESLARQTINIRADFDSNKAFVNSSITAISDATSALATQVTDLTALVTSSSAGIDTFVQDDPPTGADVGDIWFDSNDGYKIYRWDGSAWQPVRDTDISVSIARIVNIETNYATQTYASSVASSAQTAAIASANGYTDGAITHLSTVYVTPSEAVSTADSRISASLSSTTAGTIGAAIQSEATTRATNETALGTRIDGIAASVGAHTYIQSTAPTSPNEGDLWFDTSHSNKLERWTSGAWVDATDQRVSAVITTQSAQATSLGYLDARYSLQVISGNVVTGMYLTSTSTGATSISDITFQASSFKIKTTTTAVAPFQVSGDTVRVTGSLIITSSDVGGLGALATLSSVDLSTSQVANKSLANLDSTANTKLAGIQAGATAGASWGTNLTGVPVSLSDGRVAIALNAAGTVVTKVVPGATAAPGASGLYLGSDYLGFFNGSAWKTYMDNSGHFFLAGASSNALAWDGTTLSIVGNVTVTGGNAATTTDLATKANSDMSNVTTIDGGKISTGTISAAKISVSDLGDINGSLTVGTGNTLTKVTQGQIKQGVLSIDSTPGTAGITVSTTLKMSSLGTDFIQLQGILSTLPVVLSGGNSTGTYWALTSTGNMSWPQSGGAVAINENWGFNVNGDGTHPLRVVGGALVLGSVGAGSGFTAGRVYDGGGNQILRERYGSTPSSLSDVIACLQYHGLCS